MSEEDAEINALSDILTALNKVPEERRSHVLRYVAERAGVTFDSTGDISTYQPKSQLPTADVSTPSTDLAEYVKQKKPVNNYQTLATIARYLQQYEGVTEFSNKDLSSAVPRARIPKIGGIHQAIKDAEYHYKFFTKALNGKNRQLTTLGEAVVDALPDQEKVKEVLSGTNHRRKKRSKPKK